MPDAERRRLAAVHRANVAVFAEAMVAVHPSRSIAEATSWCMPHGRWFSMWGRTRRFDTDPALQAEVYAMVCAVLRTAPR